MSVKTAPQYLFSKTGAGQKGKTGNKVRIFTEQSIVLSLWDMTGQEIITPWENITEEQQKQPVVATFTSGYTERNTESFVFTYEYRVKVIFLILITVSLSLEDSCQLQWVYVWTCVCIYVVVCHVSQMYRWLQPFIYIFFPGLLNVDI